MSRSDEIGRMRRDGTKSVTGSVQGMQGCPSAWSQNPHKSLQERIDRHKWNYTVGQRKRTEALQVRDLKPDTLWVPCINMKISSTRA